MSTPQLEDGFVRIANELLEAILAGGFSHHEQSIILAVIRKTYGYGKKSDDMSAAQIGALCGIARQHVTSALNALTARNVINKSQGKFGMIIGIQKDHRRWVSKAELRAMSASPESGQGSPENGHVQKPDSASPESGQVDSPEFGHTKDNLPKDNHQKKKPCAPQADREQGGETPAGRKGRAKTGLPGDLADRFERFYAAYPVKKSRGRAEKEFGRLQPSEELVDAMLAALEVRKASGTWVDPKYVPHPSSWLTAQGWLDQVQAAYQPAELEVIELFNEILGAQLGEVPASIFVPKRAALIAEFLTFSNKTELARRYFTYLREQCELPPRIGFDRLIGRECYGNAIGGTFSRNAA